MKKLTHKHTKHKWEKGQFPFPRWSLVTTDAPEIPTWNHKVFSVSRTIKCNARADHSCENPDLICPYGEEKMVLVPACMRSIGEGRMTLCPGMQRLYWRQLTVDERVRLRAGARI